MHVHMHAFDTLLFIRQPSINNSLSNESNKTFSSFLGTWILNDAIVFD